MELLKKLFQKYSSLAGNGNIFSTNHREEQAWRKFLKMNVLSSRVAEQHGLYKTLLGDYDDLIKAQMENRYTDGTLFEGWENFITSTINPLRRVADILSLCYAKPPERSAFEYGSDKEDSQNKKKLERMIQDCHDFDRALHWAEKVLHGPGNPVIWPHIISKSGKRVFVDDIRAELKSPQINLRVIPPHLCELFPSKDYQFDIISYWDDLELWSASIFEVELNKRVNYWVALDEETGEIQRKWEALDLSAPVVVSEKGYQGAEVWEYHNNLPLGRATLNCAEKEVFSEHVAFLKSFKQPVEGEQAVDAPVPDSQNIGPKNVLTGGLEFIDLVDKDLTFEEMLEKKAAIAARAKNVSTSTYFGDRGKMEQAQVVQFEKLQHFENQLNIWQAVERQLFDNIIRYLAIPYNLLPQSADDWVVSTNFREPITVLDPKKRLEIFEIKERLGATNIYELIRSENEDVNTDSRAEKTYMANQEIRAKRVNVSRSLQIPNEQATNEEELTQKIKGVMTGPQGAEGPNMINQKEIIDE